MKASQWKTEGGQQSAEAVRIVLEKCTEEKAWKETPTDSNGVGLRWAL